MKNVGRSLGAILVTAIVGGAPVAIASEPGNNTFTPSSVALTGDWEVMVDSGSGHSFGVKSGSLSSTTDVDYILVTCGSQDRQHIETIQLGGDSTAANQPLPGDFDIYLYDLDSNSAFASGTLGGTSAESIDLTSSHRNTVVAKVVWFAGSVGTYYLRPTCWNGGL